MDATVEDRIIDLFPVATSFERELMLRNLQFCGGPRTTEFLLDLLDDAAASLPGDERAAALGSLSQVSGPDHLDVYVRHLGHRNLWVQIVALGCLFKHDQDGQAAQPVLRWLRRRLKGRQERKSWDWHELPLAIAYLAVLDPALAEAADLLKTYDTQLDAVERRVLELMWPEKHRRPDSPHGFRRPDRSNMDEYGHRFEYYLQIEAELTGNPPPDVRSRLPEDDDPESIRAEEMEFLSLLDGIERRRLRRAGR